jgi:hypothetical protein
MSEKKRKFEAGLLVEGYIECFVETEQELKDARHALDEAHRILYETERRYKNAMPRSTRYTVRHWRRIL